MWVNDENTNCLLCGTDLDTSFCELDDFCSKDHARIYKARYNQFLK